VGSFGSQLMHVDAPALDREEHQLGSHAIAVPILQADDAIAALGVTLTRAEHDRADFDTLACTITAHATGLNATIVPASR
jgi:DNA-binding IclR family transcriptional regulator